MQVIAKLHNLRIAPRKARLVADLIRGKSAEEAQTILRFTVKKSAQPILKLLNSAIANAKHNFQLDPKNLYISKITADEGSKLKRWMPRARGQAYEIQKKISHITIVLEPKEGVAKKLRKSKKAAAAAKEEMKISKEALKSEKPKFRPELEIPRPRIEKGLKRVFRRKAF